MVRVLKQTVSGVMAGLLIAIGGGVYLAADNRIVGAVFFSVALLCICYQGYSLFTGKVGYLWDAHKKDDLSVLFLGLLGNTLATVLCGRLLAYAVPKMELAAALLCRSKLAEQNFLQTLIRAFFCGILVYLAVVLFRDKKTVLGILLGIPVFILSGFEHSIADIFYFAASGIVSLEAFGFLATVLLGNALGGLLLPTLERIGKEKPASETSVSPVQTEGKQDETGAPLAK